MKIHRPFFESAKLNEKWIKEFQQLSAHNQQRLRAALVKYSIDIENSDFVLFNPAQLDSRAEQLKSPIYKVLFLCQKRDEKTGQPGPLELLGIYSEGKFRDEFAYNVRADDVYYDFYGNEVTPSHKGKTVPATNWQRRVTGKYQVQAPPIDLKYLSRKEIIKLSRYIVVISSVGSSAIKSSGPLKAVRAGQKQGMVTRKPVYFNPADNQYYTDPRMDKYSLLMPQYRDKSGFEVPIKKWADKLKKYRQDKVLSQGDATILNAGLAAYEKLASKTTLKPGITAVPQNISDMLYAMRSFASDLQDYFNTLEDIKRRPQDEYYLKRAQSQLLELPRRTKEMERLAA